MPPLCATRQHAGPSVDRVAKAGIHRRNNPHRQPLERRHHVKQRERQRRERHRCEQPSMTAAADDRSAHPGDPGKPEKRRHAAAARLSRERAVLVDDPLQRCASAARQRWKRERPVVAEVFVRCRVAQHQCIVDGEGEHPDCGARQQRHGRGA